MPYTAGFERSHILNSYDSFKKDSKNTKIL